MVYRDETTLKDDDMLDLIEVELLKKPGRGLGLSIVGRRNGPGVYISDVVKGGAAEADGRLMQGDQILTVNGSDLRTASQVMGKLHNLLYGVSFPHRLIVKLAIHHVSDSAIVFCALDLLGKVNLHVF